MESVSTWTKGKDREGEGEGGEGGGGLYNTGNKQYQGQVISSFDNITHIRIPY